MEGETSNDINTLVIVEEQWTKLEQTVWKNHLANTRLAVYHASFLPVFNLKESRRWLSSPSVDKTI